MEYKGEQMDEELAMLTAVESDDNPWGPGSYQYFFQVDVRGKAQVLWYDFYQHVAYYLMPN